MTGFGDASEQVDGVHYAIEVRTLNNRYFKSTIRLPDEITGLEAELESLLRKRISRGSITLTIKTRQSDAQAAHEINDEAILVYLKHLEAIHQKVADRSVNIDLTALLALPGVLTPMGDAMNMVERSRPVVTRLTELACDRMTQMRCTEGGVLARELLGYREAIRTRLTLIAERAPQVVEEYHLRIRARIDELMARAQLKLAENDLIREVAVFAERSDISEEVSRLTAHLDQFEQIIGNTDAEPAGRTLDFLSQELLREANTIASKSADAQISRAIVEVKGLIDRIKEQVQNVE